MDTTHVAERVLVSVATDGSITVQHSGIEVGQGIDTKIMQAVAMALTNIAPVDMSGIRTEGPKSTKVLQSAPA